MNNQFDFDLNRHNFFMRIINATNEYISNEALKRNINKTNNSFNTNLVPLSYTELNLIERT